MMKSVMKKVTALMLILGLTLPQTVWASDEEIVPEILEETLMEEIPEVDSSDFEMESEEETLLEVPEDEEETAVAYAASVGWNKVNGKYRYYQKNGTYLQNKFQKISGKWYYFDEKGYVSTGWKTIDQKIYYFKATGQAGVIGQRFQGRQNIGANTYYFNSDGVLQTGWQKISGQTFYFKQSGAYGVKGKLLTGWLTLQNKNYYLKMTGAKGVKGRLLKGWQNIGGKTYYFNSDGSMKTGWSKIGKYTFYFKASGSNGVKGQMFLGLTNVSGKTYYFKKTGDKGVKGARFENRNYTINGVVYHFDANGVATKLSGDYVMATDPTDGKSHAVEPQYYSDPQIGTGANEVTEEEFLAAVLYTEAGDQGLTGQTLVGVVIYNRLMSKSYPNTLPLVVYDNQQFEVARNGHLTNLLKKLRDHDADTISILKKYGSFDAAKEATKIYEDYKSGKTTKRVIPGIKASEYGRDFSHLYFMTPKAFANLGLSESKCDSFTYTYKNSSHIFFKKWVYA